MELIVTLTPNPAIDINRDGALRGNVPAVKVVMRYSIPGTELCHKATLCDSLNTSSRCVCEQVDQHTGVQHDDSSISVRTSR